VFENGLGLIVKVGRKLVVLWVEIAEEVREQVWA